MKFFLIIIFFLTTAAIAQEPLRLDDAISIALKNSLDIQVSKNTVQENAVLNSYGVAGGLPLISGSASNNEQVTSLSQKLSNGTNTNRKGVAANSINSNITASILLYNGMRVVSTKKRLEELQNQSEDLLNSQVQNVIAAVMTKYYDIVRQQSYEQTIRVSILASQKRLEILNVRKSAGLANNADVYQAQIDLNALNQTLQTQELVVNLAKADLLTLLTLQPDSLINIEDTILVDRNVMLDSVLNRLSTNPDIIAASREVRINELIEKETAAQRYPSLRLSTGFSYNRNKSEAGFNLLNQTYGPTVGLTLSVPIYNGSSYKRQQQAAEINTKNAQLQKDILIRDYTSGVVKNYQAYVSTLKQLATEQDNYKLAEQLLQLTLERFQLRAATIIEVRDAQQSFEEAGFRLVNLAYAAKASEIELKRVSNNLVF